MTMISSHHQPLVDHLDALFGQKIQGVEEHRGQLTVLVGAEDWLDVAWQMRDEPTLAFEQLTDLCGVDYLGFGDDEWETAEATGEGFSRGVDAL
jgi:NADH-quinone oxidoreductase subunit C